ncbi:MAG: succinate dehydrogenase, hydrophobic membrane anchor protein [Candidatus Competibacterales bacterium]
MSLRTPIARARGMGSAKEGVEHWWHQRLTAVSNAVLILWFVFFFLVPYASADHATLTRALQQPHNAVPLILLLLSLFYHMTLGLQVVIEDYVHIKPVKIAALLGIRFVAVGLGAVAIFSVLRIAFGS